MYKNGGVDLLKEKLRIEDDIYIYMNKLTSHD